MLPRQLRLLFVSPVVPALTGNGLAMRAGAILRALAWHYQVTLLIAPLYGVRRAPVPDDIRACCARVIPLGETSSLSPRERFDVVHVYQLAALPFAQPWLSRARLRHLDLADVDSVSRRRIAALHARLGDEGAARREGAAADHARSEEDAALSSFHRVSVCSETDRALLRGRGQAEIVVLPNTLPAPLVTPAPPSDAAPWVCLFVGTLGYFPNEDAARFFGTEILPMIQAETARPVVAHIVGAGGGPGMRRLAALPGVEVVGRVADVTPWYRGARVAVVPLRAGGGTRIKVLEAFAHGRPVVTTTIGMEGIRADPDRHALVADAPDAFAAACLRLLRDQPLADAIAREAFTRFCQTYSDECLARTVAALVSDPPRPGSGAGDAPPVPR